MPTTPNEKLILKAAKSGDVATVQALLEQDKSLLNTLDSDGSTPLHCASWKGHLEVVTVLLEFGSNIQAKNQNDHWGDTALHAAAHGNQKTVVEILVARGADINAVNANGRTPLQETESHKATAAAKVLKAHGAT